MQDRPIAFSKIIRRNTLDGFIVTNPVNIFYLCGFRGISPAEREAILIFSHGATLITAKLYQAEALNLRTKKLKIAIADERNKIFDVAQKLLAKAHKVGFEEANLTYAEFREFQKKLSKTKLVLFKNLVENLRIIKSEDEIRNIEKAQKISHKAFNELIKTIKIGQTEAEIAERLAAIIKSLDAQGLAFESIVASGPNAALPHYVTGKKKIKKGEVLLFDFGAKYKDYCADLSRTIFIGHIRESHRNVYQYVAVAQKKAITIIKNGVKTSAVYEAANSVFKAQKLDKYFLHGLGHGVGLEVHEAPHLRPVPIDLTNQKKMTDEKLLENMVFSVEPGLYFPMWGGIRIEDLVVIKNGEAKVLGKIADQLIEIH